MRWKLVIRSMLKVFYLISITTLILISCSPHLSNNIVVPQKLKSDNYSSEISFLRDFQSRSTGQQIYLADSSTKASMEIILDSYGQLTFTYLNLDSLIFDKTNSPILQKGFGSKNIQLEKIICDSLHICPFDNRDKIDTNKLMLISAPIKVIHNERPIVFILAKTYEPKTINMNHKDTTIMFPKFWLFSGLKNDGEWTGYITCDLH